MNCSNVSGHHVHAIVTDRLLPRDKLARPVNQTNWRHETHSQSINQVYKCPTNVYVWLIPFTIVRIPVELWLVTCGKIEYRELDMLRDSASIWPLHSPDIMPIGTPRSCRLRHISTWRSQTKWTCASFSSKIVFNSISTIIIHMVNNIHVYKTTTK